MRDLGSRNRRLCGFKSRLAHHDDYGLLFFPFLNAVMGQPFGAVPWGLKKYLLIFYKKFDIIYIEAER